jgi:hypothetical protein
MQGSLLRTVDSCESEIQLDLTVFKFERIEMILKYMSLPRSYFIFPNFFLCVRVARKDGKRSEEISTHRSR